MRGRHAGHRRRHPGGSGQVHHRGARPTELDGRPGRLAVEGRRGEDAQGFQGSLQAVRRRRLERPAAGSRVGRAGPAQTCLHAGDRDGDLGQHGVLALPAAHAGRDRGAAALRQRPAEEDLPRQDGVGRLDGDDEPDRAAGRLRPRAAALQGGEGRGSLPHQRPEDLHHLRRARHDGEHCASRARAHARCASGGQGDLALRGAQVHGEAGRLARRAQYGCMCLDRAQARHSCEPDGGDGVRQRSGLPRGRGEQGPVVHVRHDECRTLWRGHGRRGDCRARLPAGARLREGSHAGQRPRRWREDGGDHQPPRCAPHADADEVADRGDARAGLCGRGRDGCGSPPPGQGDAPAEPGVCRTDDSRGQGLEHRDRHRCRVPGRADPWRHGLHRGNRRRAAPA